jgi:uncharacterized membrane protein
VKRILPSGAADFEKTIRSGRLWNSNPRPSHRAAAARARKLRAEATTRRLKEHLDDAIARHEQIAEEIEVASEAGADAEAPRDETAASLSDTPELDRGRASSHRALRSRRR